MHGIKFRNVKRVFKLLQTRAKCLYVCLHVLYAWPPSEWETPFPSFRFINTQILLYRHVWYRNNYDKTENPQNIDVTFKITIAEQRDFCSQQNTSQETTGLDLHIYTTPPLLDFFSLYSFVFFCLQGEQLSFHLCLIFSSCFPRKTSLSLWYQQTGCQRKIA